MQIPRSWRRRARRFYNSLSGAAELVFSVLAAGWLGQRRRRPSRRARTGPTTADERTIRRIAEEQSGGLSSAESDARYVRGENPGGLHHKARRPPPDAEMFELEEPVGRTEKHRGTRRTMAFTRRGT